MMPTERNLPTENDCQESIDWNVRRPSCFFFFLDKQYQTCSHMEGKNSSHSLPTPFFVHVCWNVGVNSLSVVIIIMNGLFQVGIVEWPDILVFLLPCAKNRLGMWSQ